jgi:hypothetical protein
MRQKSNTAPVSSENLVRDIRRATRKHHAAEEKIRIVLDGLDTVAPVSHVGPSTKFALLAFRTHFALVLATTSQPSC